MCINLDDYLSEAFKPEKFDRKIAFLESLEKSIREQLGPHEKELSKMKVKATRLLNEKKAALKNFSTKQNRINPGKIFKAFSGTF